MQEKLNILDLQRQIFIHYNILFRHIAGQLACHSIIVVTYTLYILEVSSK